MVRAAGFEPTVSWTRTKRDTKLRHARIGQLMYYMCFPPGCQEEYFMPDRINC